jgi:hypothetical protein
MHRPHPPRFSSSSPSWLLAGCGWLALSLLVAGCKQDVGERCEYDGDCYSGICGNPGPNGKCVGGDMTEGLGGAIGSGTGGVGGGAEATGGAGGGADDASAADAGADDTAGDAASAGDTASAGDGGGAVLPWVGGVDAGDDTASD